MSSSLSLNFDHLHLGCGLTTPEGWLNVDGSWQVMLARYPRLKKLLVAARIFPRRQAEIPWSARVVRLDLTRPLPYPDGAFAAVYSSHTLEHLYHRDALALLRESHRVLRPGGVCRAVVPDLEAMVARYLSGKKTGEPEAGNRLMEDLLMHDREPRRGAVGLYYKLTAFHQHKWMYDATSLQKLFEEAGFRQVQPMDYGESCIARVGEVERPDRILDGQGVAVEGIKE